MEEQNKRNTFYAKLPDFTFAVRTSVKDVKFAVLARHRAGVNGRWSKWYVLHRAGLAEDHTEELEKCISQLIEAGEKLGSTQFGWTDEREHWTAVVKRTKTILAKGAK
jgi:hypothetical protein